ncbi:unnamed protein product, partial [marine sediment metagenome]
VALSHLYGKYLAGVLAQQYPQYFNMTFYNQPHEYVDYIRESLMLDERNSNHYRNEAADCDYIYGLPSYNGRPPTIDQLHNSFNSFAGKHNVRIFPHPYNYSLLPFSPHFDSCDPACYNLDTWQDEFHALDTLDEVDISYFPGNQLDLKLMLDIPAKLSCTKWEGKELFEHGRQSIYTRNDSQYKILYYLWRDDFTQRQAILLTFKWVKENYYDIDKYVRDYPKMLKEEIDR